VADLARGRPAGEIGIAPKWRAEEGARELEPLDA
jgi:hypothetical protein